MKILNLILRQLQNWATVFTQSFYFVKDCLAFQLENTRDGRFSLNILDLYPCLLDRTADTTFEPHYIYHPAWATRVLKKLNPKKHIDISSTLHFCSMISAFIPTEFYDYRPAKLFLPNLASKKGDLMQLPFETGSVESISCMHTIEHIGLGRYGDPIDPTADLKAIRELQRVTEKGGSILFVTPIGKKKLRFNAHRIYAYQDIVRYFGDCTLKEFSLVPDNVMDVGMLKNPSVSLTNQQDWGCGCFWFIKK
jgi:hypothetical protein